MEPPVHPLSALFAQLGLPSDVASIDAFIASHSPLANDIPIAAAPFWSPTQAAFLREELAEDADWAEVIDELSARLRHG
ncbi:MAG: DUF2789 domain-containing protein [Rhodocyclaceae bacterium]|nr:DUF2789 domain-containing protein [Rhodocyclaceae bacterium]MCB1963538.1 DUF2789 domain-containing protein [Rhodocyclaceae bacterium]